MALSEEIKKYVLQIWEAQSKVLFQYWSASELLNEQNYFASYWKIDYPCTYLASDYTPEGPVLSFNIWYEEEPARPGRGLASWGSTPIIFGGFVPTHIQPSSIERPAHLSPTNKIQLPLGASNQIPKAVKFLFEIINSVIYDDTLSTSSLRRPDRVWDAGRNLVYGF